MAHALVRVPVHIVFSTKDRLQLIPKEKQARTWAYMAGICHQHKMFVHEIDGMADHVHLLIDLPPTLALADAVEKLKPARLNRWERVLRGSASMEHLTYPNQLWARLSVTSGIRKRITG